MTNENVRQAAAAQLRAEKAVASLTNDEIASAAGVSERTIRRYLRAERAVDLEDFMELAGAFGITPGELLRRVLERVNEPDGASAQRGGDVD